MDEIKNYLQKNGPSLSTDIVQWITTKSRISKETAQKRVSRKMSTHEIGKLESIHFKNNSSFLYLAKDYNTNKYWNRLLNVLKTEKSPYYDFICAVIALGGIVSFPEIRVFSSFPDRLRGKIDFMLFYNSLLDSNIIKEIDAEKRVFQINVCIHRNTNNNQFEARQISTEYFIKGISEWFKSNGLVYSKSLTNQIDSSKTFSHYYYSTFGLSYVLANNFKGSDTFIVLDYMDAERGVGSEEINYFITKVESTRKANFKIKFLPFIISTFFTPSALTELRSKGIIATTVKNLLGEQVSDLLNELKADINSIANDVKTNKSTFLDVVHKVNKTFGITDNLRGKLFEYFIATIRFYEHHLDFEVGKLITDPTTYEKAEIDIIQFNGTRQIHIIECKALTSDIDEDDIEIFFKKIARIMNWIKSNDIYRSAEVLFYYYTLSDFTVGAKTKLSEKTKYEIKTKNKNEIIQLVRGFKEKDLSKTFEDYFL